MSGIPGYIVCKATLESVGLLSEFSIHFVQDLIIFTALSTINERKNPAGGLTFAGERHKK